MWRGRVGMLQSVNTVFGADLISYRHAITGMISMSAVSYSGFISNRIQVDYNKLRQEVVSWLMRWVWVKLCPSWL